MPPRSAEATATLTKPRFAGWYGNEVPYQPSKDDRSCCNARRDKLGRLPIGFCGPECEGILHQALFLEYQAWWAQR